MTGTEARKIIDKWLLENAFNERGTTYIYFPRDSYDKRGELKDAGFRFHKDLLWHIAEIPEGYEDVCVEVPFEEVAILTVWGQALFKPEVKKIIDKILDEKRPKIVSKSEWVGEADEKIKHLPAKLNSIKDITTKYGTTKLVEFEDEEGNIYNWWTQTNIPLVEGTDIFLNGTIKRHTIYNGVKITVISYVKMKAKIEE